VDLLTADGRLLSFGPFEAGLDTIDLEIYRERIGDDAPAEFGVKASHATT
jgi:hypothetical protein